MLELLLDPFQGHRLIKILKCCLKAVSDGHRAKTDGDKKQHMNQGLSLLHTGNHIRQKIDIHIGGAHAHHDTQSC